MVWIMYTYDFRQMEKLFQTVETGKYTNWIYTLNVYSLQDIAEQQQLVFTLLMDKS